MPRTPEEYLDLLVHIAPRVSGAKMRRQDRHMQEMAEVLPAVCAEFAIDTDLRLAHFLAQAAQESDGFCAMEEYASGAAYEGRKDLGNVHPGDGRRHKGRGPFMLTGRFNYGWASEQLGIDLVDDPNDPADDDDPLRAAEVEIGMRIAGLYWTWKGLNELADADDVRGITRKISGGYNGFSERKRYLAKAKAALGLAEGPDRQLLRIGADGPDVVTLQNRLHYLRYFVGKIDGLFGPRTDTQVRAFQRDRGLDIDGLVRVGGPTWEALEMAVAAQEAAPVADERAETGVIDLARDGSRIAGSSIKGAGAAISGLAVSAGAILAEASSTFKDQAGHLGKLMEPFGGASNIALGLLALAAVYSAWQHVRSGRARAEDARTGKTA